MRSITAGVTDSSVIAPDRGSSSEPTIDRYPDTVAGLRPRSCSTYCSHSAAASANVTPLLRVPGRARYASGQGRRFPRNSATPGEHSSSAAAFSSSSLHPSFRSKGGVGRSLPFRQRFEQFLSSFGQWHGNKFDNASPDRRTRIVRAAIDHLRSGSQIADGNQVYGKDTPIRINEGRRRVLQTRDCVRECAARWCRREAPFASDQSAGCGGGASLSLTRGDPGRSGIVVTACGVR